MKDRLNLSPEEREAFADIYESASGRLVQRCDWEGTEPGDGLSTASLLERVEEDDTPLVSKD